MFANSIMIPKNEMIFVQSHESLNKALERLNDHKIDGMPVLDNGNYDGIVTRDRLYELSFLSSKNKEELLESMTCGEAAIHKNVSINEDEIFEETLLHVKDQPVVAVTNKANQCQGIVTRFDILEQFESAFGMKHKGVRLAFASVETEGRLLRLAEITKQFHQNIISLATFDETDKLIRRIIMKVEHNRDVTKFIRKLEKHGFHVLHSKITK